MKMIMLLLSFITSLFSSQNSSTAQAGDAPLDMVVRAVSNGRSTSTLTIRPYHVLEPLGVVGQKDVTLPGGIRAGTAILRDTEWSFPAPQRPQPNEIAIMRNVMALPEAERLRRYPDSKHLNEIQVWYVSLEKYPQAGVGLKSQLQPEKITNQDPVDLFYAGRGHGYAWFFDSPLATMLHIQKQLALSNGEDLLAAAIRALKQSHGGRGFSSNRSDCLRIISQAGATAIPALNQAIKDAHPERAVMITQLSLRGEPAVSAWLLTLANSADPEVALGARNGLLIATTKEAEGYYRKWLDEDIGHASVEPLLRAAESIKMPGLESYAKRVMESPPDIDEYEYAFVTLRRLQGREFPGELKDAEARILSLGYSSTNPKARDKAIDVEIQKILKSPDHEAAAVVAVKLLLDGGKGGPPLAVVNAGARIISQLPAGQALVNCLAQSKHTQRNEPEINILKSRLSPDAGLAK